MRFLSKQTESKVKDKDLTHFLTFTDQIAIANELERRMAEIEKLLKAADKQMEAINALPGAILEEVFDFEEEARKSLIERGGLK